MALVVLNLRAGGGRAARLAGPMQEMLRLHHAGTALETTDSVAAAQRAIRRAPRGSRVVVVGGDGTLHQLLPALLDGAHEVGLVPAGSGDDAARGLGLRGARWQRALTLALTTPARAVDIGWVHTEHEQRPFLSNLCAGFDAAVAQRALAGPSWLRGTPRYLLATLKELAALRLYPLRVSADGQPLHDGPALFASTLNTPSYGGGMPAVPQALLDDGRLNLLLAGRFTRAAALTMLPRLLTGSHLGHHEVASQPFAKLQIESELPLPLAADGEPLRSARAVNVRVGQGVLQVVATHEGRFASSSDTRRTTSLSSDSTE